MRAIVYVLALFAALKVGMTEYLFRSSTREVIAAAYRDRAIQACQKDSRTLPAGTTPQVWARPADVRVVVGNANLDVHLWQVDHQLWNARFRNPYLLLSPSDDKAGGVVCEYDVVNNTAVLARRS